MSKRQLANPENGVIALWILGMMAGVDPRHKPSRSETVGLWAVHIVALMFALSILGYCLLKLYSVI